MEPTQKGVMN